MAQPVSIFRYYGAVVDALSHASIFRYYGDVVDALSHASIFRYYGDVVDDAACSNLALLRCRSR